MAIIYTWTWIHKDDGKEEWNHLANYRKYQDRYLKQLAQNLRKDTGVPFGEFAQKQRIFIPCYPV